MIAADGEREFSCFPAAILGFIVDADDRVLLLSNPARGGGWEVVNGAIEEGESPVAARHPVDDRLRFLAPFDPVVWDRRRFQLFWGWEYKLEAYVPAHKRRMGHYAMPMLWGEQILGWANLKVVDGRLQHELGFAGSRPRGRAFPRALDEALQRMQEFLEL